MEIGYRLSRDGREWSLGWEYFRCIYLRSERKNAMICRENFCVVMC
jgi:hypothetical protein